MASPNEMPIAVLHNLFDCDFDTGVLRYRVRHNCMLAGELAGSAKPDGYVRIQIQRKTFGAHRIVWAMYYGQWPINQIDHRDGNRSNNAISNLRMASPKQNTWNRKKPASGLSSKLKGVTWNRNCQKWQAQIQGNGKTYYLGLFLNELDAHDAYARKARELFGDFARVA